MPVAAEKASILRVQVPSCQWPDSGTERYHSSCGVTTRSWRGVNGPAAQKTESFGGRSNLGASQVGEPAHHGRTAAPHLVRHGRCHHGGSLSAPHPLQGWCGRGSAGRNGSVPRRSAAGYGSTHRHTDGGDHIGKGLLPAGARGNLPRLASQATERRACEGGGLAHAPGGARRAGERRSRERARSPRRGNTPTRRRGSRYREGQAGDTRRDLVLDSDGERSRWRAAECTRHVRGVGARALKLPRAGEG